MRPILGRPAAGSRAAAGDEDPARDQQRRRATWSADRAARRGGSPRARRRRTAGGSRRASRAPARSVEIDRNQRMFVSTSGPIVAKTSSAQISQPTIPVLLARLRDRGEREQRPRARDHDRADARRRVARHERRDRDRVGRPGRADPEAEEDPDVAAGDLAARADARRGRRRRTRRPRRARSAGSAARDRERARRARRRSGSRRGSGRSSTPSSCRARRRSRAGSARARRAANASTGRWRRSIRSVRSTSEREHDEDRAGERVADGRVRERREAVLEDVLRDAEVERPEHDRRQQHQLDGRQRRSHSRRPYRPLGFARWPSRRRDDIDALVGPATPHFAYQLRARVRELIEDLPDDHPVRRTARRRWSCSTGSGTRRRWPRTATREPRTRHRLGDDPLLGAGLRARCRSAE